MLSLLLTPWHSIQYLTFIYLFGLFDRGNTQATPFTPPAVPLAVVHPYLSTWLMNGTTNLGSAWSNFAVQNQVTGWAGFVRVDGQAYRFLGNAPFGEQANQTGLEWTATRSTFTFAAGPMTLIAEFLTPIEPDSLVNQSMPFSYLTVSVKSDQQHDVQIYTDISGEFLADDPSIFINWLTNTSSQYYVHEAALQKPQTFFENGDRAHFYQSYYATKQGKGVSYQTGRDVDTRTQFTNNGTLTNSQDTNSRAINDNWPVFALSYDLGQVSDTTSNPAVFAIGLAPQNDAGCVQYIQSDASLHDRYSYYLSEMSTLDALEAFLEDYPNAKERANTFDSQLVSDAGKISTEYADLVSLAARQTFGAIQITISRDASGNFNQSDILTFMKEIGSSGSINTIDVIYPSHPIFLYTNPVILSSLLEPHLRYMESGQYNQLYVPHDLGIYPVAGGTNPNSPNQPLEESGNLLIMAMAAARISGNGNQLNNHLKTFQGIADYLAGNALTPNQQASTDNFLGPQANTSNLALKGIIALSAMQDILVALNKTDNNTYGDVANSFINQWTQLAVVNTSSQQPGRVLSGYGNATSFALPYNLYADQLLQTKLVPSFVYQATEDFISSPDLAGQYGVPIDSRASNNSKTDWLLFTAGAINSQSNTVRDKLIHGVHAYAAAGNTSTPFPDYYNILTGQTALGFQARPVQGAMFSLLALNKPSKQITLQPSDASSPTQPPSPSSSGDGKHKGASVPIEIFNISKLMLVSFVTFFTFF